MQKNSLKLLLFIVLTIGASGCAETVYLNTDKGVDSIEVISNFWVYCRLLVSLLVIALGLMCVLIAEEGKWTIFIICSFIAILVSFGLLNTVTKNDFASNPELVIANERYQEMSELELTYKEYKQKKQLGTDRYNLKKQIDKAKRNIDILKQDRKEKVLPLKEEYSKMYSQYYPQLATELKETVINSHEELLRNCDNNLELCSLLNRVAKLSYYIEKLNDRLNEIRINLIKLDNNLWDLERTFELSQIFSNDELEHVEKLIQETQGKIDSQVPPPQKQDIASLEAEIFSNILGS
ncbi:MAG: hypothetical protein ABEI32_13820 [Halothece sp.]